MKPFKTTGIQYAALPYRIRGDRAQVMLITSRRTRRWIIPKGWPMEGMKPAEAAAQEAAEEAGIVGAVADKPIGSYRYLKRLKGDQTLAVQVIVFPFEVAEQVPTFKEKGQRTHAWFDYQEAAFRIGEPSLKRLIRDFGASRSTGLFARSLRAYRTWRFGTPG